MATYDNTDYSFGITLIASLFIIVAFILGTYIGVYFTEQVVKEAVCRKVCQQTTDYLLCKDKTIEEVLNNDR